MMKLHIAFRKFFVIGILFAVPLIYCGQLFGQITVILVSPKYNVTDSRYNELRLVSNGLQSFLKEEIEDLSYKCIPYYFGDWDIYDETTRVTKMGQQGAKYVISTDQIKILTSNAGFEVNFIIDTLSLDGKLIRQTWYESEYIVKGSAGKTMETVAKRVSEDFNFFCATGQFKPRIQIVEFEKKTEDIIIDQDEFANWLEGLLKNKVTMYIFYYDEKIYPASCDNVLTGELGSQGASGEEPVDMVIFIKAEDNEKKIKSYKIYNSEEFLEEDLKNKLVEEIQKKLEDLINNN